VLVGTEHTRGIVATLPCNGIGALVLAFGAFCAPVFALNPSLDINQYAHTAWTIRDGHFKGTVFSIAQTPDGYLWLGTDFGLVRFDGMHFSGWQPPNDQPLPSTSILNLLSVRDGTLWIGTNNGLASWKGGKLRIYPQLAGHRIFRLADTPGGVVWVVADTVGLWKVCAIRGDAVECYGRDAAFGGIHSMHPIGEDVWVLAQSGLWRLGGGSWKQYPGSSRLRGGDLNETSDGHLIVATVDGIREFVNDQFRPYSPGVYIEPGKPKNLLRDRDGGLWLGTTDSGLFHIHQGSTDRFARLDGLTGDYVLTSFEDREGNVWVATLAGLDRFREFAVSTISSRQGLSGDAVWSVVASRDGGVWVGGQNGLNLWRKGQVTTFRKEPGLPDPVVESMFEGHDGRLWLFTRGGLVSHQDGRFTRNSAVTAGQVHAIAADGSGNVWLSEDSSLLHLRDGELVEEVSWPQLGAKRTAISLMPGIEPGGLWLGFSFDRGVIYFKDGRIRQSYAKREGIADGPIYRVSVDRDGTVWAATTGGLSRIADGRVTTLNRHNGLPCETVHWSMADDDGSLWLNTSCGLVRIPRTELDAWIADPEHTVHFGLFDAADGVRLSADVTSRYSPRVSKAPDGGIWFVTADGAQVLDPRHIPVNHVPPPVHIERIVVDDQPYELKPGMRLPANPRDVTIDYTALSLTVPEKVHFKFKLEGQDPGWREVINDRKVQYSNLRPKTYRFRVKACNNSAVWNETGDTLEFSIAPAWNQTSWFYASCVAAFLAVLWGLYRLRLYQIRREFNAQLDGRVDERLRVARELHDTMLQSFQAALIQMQAAYNIFTRRPEKTGESLEKAINTAAGAIAEGRSAIQDLRLHPAGGGDLAELITTAGQELARSDEASGNPPVFGVTVEGARRDVAPLIQDEVYRIARELLRNAFRHAQAGRIEVEIRYDSRQFRLHVRDDGKGMDSEVLKAGGRAGHYGLPGMRERANRFGGKLDFWSEAGAGTEAVLTVPGGVAYGGPNGGRFAFLRRKLWIHER